ncbi:DNA polymerase epsilon subunit 3 [Leopardus geoffroyi]|nr:DNA polymerase epsilon subunit 3 [Leopardus geoffroyi]XP_045325279.1 DNA polymerase epsilon subunit 3 [Leopardus geoffroyi]
MLWRAGHCGTPCGQRGAGRKPLWVRLRGRGKSGRRSGLKKTLETEVRVPVAAMAERPEDLNLPNAVITRIIKEALPDGVNISKEARSAISRAASVFVLYATSCANNFAMKGKRKTLNASDVLSAMEEMEFQRFVTPLKEALEAYRREQKGKKEASEQKKKDKDKKTDSEEQDKSRDEDNDEDEDRLEEEEPNEEEEVDN